LLHLRGSQNDCELRENPNSINENNWVNEKIWLMRIIRLMTKFGPKLVINGSDWIWHKFDNKLDIWRQIDKIESR